MAERKKLLNSHRELIRMKKEKMNEIVKMAENAQKDMQRTADLIASELGIPENEQWKLTKNDEFFEKIITPKKPKETFPGRKNKNK